MRKSCMLCVMKHLGEAAGFESEFHLGHPEFEVYVVGALSLASQEAVRSNPELAEAIREHRMRWQAAPLSYAVPYERLGVYVRSCQDTPAEKHLPAVPNDCRPVAVDVALI